MLIKVVSDAALKNGEWEWAVKLRETWNSEDMVCWGEG